SRPDNSILLRLGVRLGEKEAYQRLLAKAADKRFPEGERVAPVELLGQIGQSDCVPVLLDLLDTAKSDALRGAALSALQPFADPRIAERVLALYPRLSATLRSRALGLLASRLDSVLALLRAVGAGRIAPRDVPLDQVRQLAQHKDERVRKLLAKHW